MTVTPFLKLQKPPFDTIPWDVAINGNMDTIDAYIAQFMSIPNFVGSWANATNYVSGQNVLDTTDGHIYLCQVTHTSAISPTTFPADRIANPSYWVQADADAEHFAIAAAASAANAASSAATASAAASSTIHYRNKIHNSMMKVRQRGVGPFTANLGYTADRWQLQFATDIPSITIATNQTSISDEEITNWIQVATFTGGGAGSYTLVCQKIENVRRLSGKTITVSFYAEADSTGPKIGVNVEQVFGTGGSPSATVVVNGQSFVCQNPAWTRFSATFTMPTANGKTLGSNGDDYTQVNFWFSAGSTNATRSGNVGVQSGPSIRFTGIQVEIASAATEIERVDPTTELLQCLRFYSLVSFDIAQYGAIGVGVWQTIPHTVPMRNTPTANVAAGATVNVAGAVVTALNYTATRVGFTITATGGASYSGTLVLNADL